ncbi:MAG TPA: hypothetical protein VLK83_07855 [Rhodanobacteraceae bacterium]|nr:hypothetical protein [Rhodanobacteraceae bacterium]
MANQISQESMPNRMQEGASESLIDNPRLGRMAAAPEKESAQATSGRSTMASDGKEKPPAAASGARVMESFAHPGKPSSSGDAPATEMQAHPRVAATEPAQSYLRLRVRVTDGRMRVIDAHSVDGPLTHSPSFAGEHAYEASLDSQSIAVEGLPDVGVSRSYPRPGQHEHHIADRRTFEFTARIARSSLPANALGRLALTVYRFPDASSKSVKSSLSREFGQQAKVVAHLDGMREDTAEPKALEHLRLLFPSSFPGTRS